MILFYARFGTLIVKGLTLRVVILSSKSASHVGVSSVSTSHPRGNMVDGLPRAST